MVKMGRSDVSSDRVSTNTSACLSSSYQQLQLRKCRTNVTRCVRMCVEISEPTKLLAEKILNRAPRPHANVKTPFLRLPPKSTKAAPHSICQQLTSQDPSKKHALLSLPHLHLLCDITKKFSAEWVADIDSHVLANREQKTYIESVSCYSSYTQATLWHTDRHYLRNCFRQMWKPELKSGSPSAAST